MEMTYSEYLDKIDAIVETALFNYEMDVMTEATEMLEKKNDRHTLDKIKAKAGALGSTIKGAIKKIWDMICSLIDKVIATFDSMLHSKDLQVMAQEDVLADVVNYNSKFAEWLNLMTTSDPSDEEFAKIESEVKGFYDSVKSAPEIAIKKGEVIPKATLMTIRRNLMKYKGLRGQALKFDKKVDRLIQKGETNHLSTIKGINKDIAACLSSTVIAQANKVAKWKKDERRDDISVREDLRAENRAAKRDARAEAKAEKQAAKQAQNESASIVDSLLEAAAMLLNEDANIKTDTSSQRDIDDIPTESSVKDDDYPADDVTGGEGIAPDNEEIKELVGGDAEAMKILADDEGSKAITESVVIEF